MRPMTSIFTIVLIVSCSNTKDETGSTKAPDNAAYDSDENLVAVKFRMDSESMGLSLLGDATVQDFTLQVNCTYGLNNQPVSRAFVKQQFAQKNAKLPKKSKNCVSYLSNLVVTSMQDNRFWSFLVPPGVTAANFNGGATVSYTYTPPATPGSNQAITGATATIWRTQEFPSSIEGESEVGFNFYIKTTDTSNRSSVTTQAPQASVTSWVHGFTPPIYSVSLTSASKPTPDTCVLVYRLQCMRNAIQSGGSLSSCNGVSLSNMVTKVNGSTLSNLAADPTRPIDSLEYRTNINCVQMNQMAQNLTFEFIDNSVPSEPNKSQFTVQYRIDISFAGDR